MKKIVIAIPHSHTWFWTQTCIASLMRNPPKADGYETEIVVVNNSPWSPAISGLYDINWSLKFSIIDNYKSNKFHASALDCIVEKFDFDLLMAWETDVLALSPTWLQWFVDQLKPIDFAVGHWHHEQFINPSCTLYRGDILRHMMRWCKENDEPNVLRWGDRFCNVQDIGARQPERDYRDWYNEQIEWIVGPFADKRGWPSGTSLREAPSGQHKGPGWYEPGQMLHHWATDAGYTYTVCPTSTTEIDGVHGGRMPIQTLYGPRADQQEWDRQLNYIELQSTGAKTAHLWGGTRALDIIKHDVTCNFVKSNTPFWLSREARFWKQVVSVEIQETTLNLIRKYGWHYTGQGSDHVSQRDLDAALYVKECYKLGGVEW